MLKHVFCVSRLFSSQGIGTKGVGVIITVITNNKNDINC